MEVLLLLLKGFVFKVLLNPLIVTLFVAGYYACYKLKQSLKD